MNLRSAPAPAAQLQAETRQQLLEAAGEVFARDGFRNARVREICRRAGANLAAVNYHFGDKETLYAEVLRHAQQKAFEKHPLLPDAGLNIPAKEKLQAFIRSFLLRIFDGGPTAWFGKMMLREMIEPTAALASLLKERIQPMADQLRNIVAEILGGLPTDENVRLCSLSIVSQCVFYHHCREVVTRLFPEQRLDVTAVEPLADHITRFSLAAMKHMPEGKPLKPRPTPSIDGRS